MPENLPSHRHPFQYIETTAQGQSAPFDIGQPALGLTYLINASAQIRLFSGDFAPVGWARPNGQILPIAGNEGLFSLIGITYGGNGVTNFALPNLRGRAVVGSGAGPGLTPRALGEQFGSALTSLTLGNLPNHTHTIPGAPATGGTFPGQAYSIVQPSIALSLGIAAQGIYPAPDSNPFSTGLPCIGEIVTYASAAMPEGILPADGRLLSISEYETLFNIIGITYGGDGETTFALPDLRGRTPIAPGSIGNTAHILGEKFGSQTHTLTQAELPPHVHGFATVPTLRNPSFEQDHYSVWPGYTTDNGGVISGWKTSGKVGLNPAPDSPFANNGATPDGSGVAFLQSMLDTETTLATTIDGLSPGTRYKVTFRTNCRDLGGVLPSASWSLNGAPFVPLAVPSPVGGTNPYREVSGTFTATAEYANVVIKNKTSNDSTLLVDQFSIAVDQGEYPLWSISPWTGDASTGISAAGTLWAYALGSSQQITVNGVTLTGLTALNPSVAGRVQLSGFTNVHTGDSNELTAGSGGSSLLAQQFHYGAASGTATLQGLTPGNTYRLSLFGAGFDEALPRLAYLAENDYHHFTVDENFYGNNKGIRIDHVFTATTATHSIRLNSFNVGQSFHLYGLALSSDFADISVEDIIDEPIPPILDFGRVPKGSSSFYEICYIHNRGLKPLNVSSIALVGGNAGDFEVNPSFFPGSLAPGDHFIIFIQMKPTSVGPRETTLRILTNDPDEPSRDFTLTGTGTDSYANWAAGQFQANASNPAIGGDNADPDGDGLANRLEYALRTDPKAANPPVFGLPEAITLPGNIPAQRFTFPYYSLGGDATYKLQRSTNLSTWADAWTLHPSGGAVGQSGVSSTLDVPGQTVTITISNATLLQVPGYWRLKVE